MAALTIISEDIIMDIPSLLEIMPYIPITNSMLVSSRK
jgi:hypothetical protein